MFRACDYGMFLRRSNTNQLQSLIPAQVIDNRDQKERAQTSNDQEWQESTEEHTFTKQRRNGSKWVECCGIVLSGLLVLVLSQTYREAIGKASLHSAHDFMLPVRNS